MKIFVIGGLTRHDASSEERSQLQAISARLGELIVSNGHDLAACSPFEDSVDFHAVKAAIALSSIDVQHINVELHYPDDGDISGAVKELFSSSLGNKSIRRFPHPPLGEMQYSWLFSQLKALDNSNGIIALGGKSRGSAQLLLEFANVRGKAILPFTFLGGASADYFAENRWRITDDLHEKVDYLNDPLMIDESPRLIEALISGKRKEERQRFFISYARDRPQEADYIEVLLKRRNLSVFRDEKDFEPSAHVQSEIFKNIRKTDVFIAVWCKEYACSPWCFDELDYALTCREKSGLEVWLLVVDETRIVPPGARDLVYYKVSTRADIEGIALNLLGR